MMACLVIVSIPSGSSWFSSSVDFESVFKKAKMSLIMNVHKYFFFEIFLDYDSCDINGTCLDPGL
jgi:hypothetical protein